MRQSRAGRRLRSRPDRTLRLAAGHDVQGATPAGLGALGSGDLRSFDLERPVGGVRRAGRAGDVGRRARIVPAVSAPHAGRHRAARAGRRCMNRARAPCGTNLALAHVRPAASGIPGLRSPGGRRSDRFPIALQAMHVHAGSGRFRLSECISAGPRAKVGRASRAGLLCAGRENVNESGPIRGVGFGPDLAGRR